MIKFLNDPENKKILYSLRDKYYSEYYLGTVSPDDFLCYEERKLVKKNNDQKAMFDAGFEAMLDIIEKISSDLPKKD
jgi:hypothetical protein